jgi:hypothetical protein
MIKLIRHYDVNGDLIEDDDDRDLKDRVLKHGEVARIPLQLMDGKSAAPPAGAYYTVDGCGRVCGVGDIAAELRRQAAYEDYCVRLASAHKKLTPMTDSRKRSLPTAAGKGVDKVNPVERWTGHCNARQLAAGLTFPGAASG